MDKNAHALLNSRCNYSTAEIKLRLSHIVALCWTSAVGISFFLEICALIDNRSASSS